MTHVDSTEYLNLIKQVAELKAQVTTLNSESTKTDDKLIYTLLGVAATSITALILFCLNWLKDRIFFKRNKEKDLMLKKFQINLDDYNAIRRIAGEALGLHHSIRIHLFEMNAANFNKIFYSALYVKTGQDMWKDESLKFKQKLEDITIKLYELFEKYNIIIGEYAFIDKSTTVVGTLNTMMSKNYLFELDDFFSDKNGNVVDKRKDLIPVINKFLFDEFNVISIEIVNTIREKELKMT